MRLQYAAEVRPRRFCAWAHNRRLDRRSPRHMPVPRPDRPSGPSNTKESLLLPELDDVALVLRCVYLAIRVVDLLRRMRTTPPPEKRS